MNRRTLNSLPLQKAITGFVNYEKAEGLSDRSVDSYLRILEHWAAFAGNKNVTQFTDQDINSYLVYMRTEEDRPAPRFQKIEIEPFAPEEVARTVNAQSTKRL
jgi:hypothetical protein